MKGLATISVLFFLALPLLGADAKEAHVTLVAGFAKYEVPKSFFENALRGSKKHGTGDLVKFGNVLAAEQHKFPHKHYKIVELWFRIQKNQKSAEELNIKLPVQKIELGSFDTKEEAFNYITQHKPHGLIKDITYKLHDGNEIFVPANSLLLSLLEGSKKHGGSRVMSALGVLVGAGGQAQPIRVLFGKTELKLDDHVSKKVSIPEMSWSKAQEEIGKALFANKDEGLEAVREHFNQNVFRAKEVTTVLGSGN